MTVLRYGRYSTTSELDFGIIGTNVARGCIFDSLTSTIIAFRGGFFGGRYDSGTPSSRVVIRSTSGANPTARLGYTNTISPSTQMTSVANGAMYQASLTEPLLLRSGSKYFLEITSAGARLGHSMQQASRITATYEDFYQQNITSSLSPTTYGGVSIGTQGHLTVWVEGDINEAPNVPGSVTPSGFVSTLTPTLSATFSDANETLSNGTAWDVVKQYQVQVRLSGSSSTLWDYTGSATSGQQSAKLVSLTYGGTTLSYGSTYETRWRMSDLADAWSSWSAWTSFTINPGGTLAIPTSPSGKQTTLTPGPFTAGWSHVSSLAANRVQIRLMQGEAVVATSAELTLSPTVSAGSNISISWATSGFASGTLAWGIAYGSQMRARDTSGVWSPWSASLSFNTNAYPNTPSEVYPSSGGLPISALPLLTYSGSDPDDAASTLTPTFEITRADATVVTRTGSWDSALGRFKYQVTSTDIPSYQTFTWRGKLSDGTLESGWSVSSSIIYGAGPTVTVSSPSVGATVTVANPSISWSTSGQVSYRLYVYRSSDDLLVYDTGSVTSAASSVVVPSGTLRNGTSYYVVVAVTNSVPLTGYSPAVTFTVSYTSPAALVNVTAAARRIGYDSVPTAIDVGWTSPDLPQSRLQKISIRRREAGTDSSTAVTLAEISSINQNTFTDYRPRSGVSYVYSVSYFEIIGADVVESLIEERTAQVDLRSVVLTAVVGGDQLRAELLFDSGRDLRLINDRRKVVPFGATRGRSIRSPLSAWELSGTYRVVGDGAASAAVRIEDLRELVSYSGTICYRDERRRIFFVTIDSYEETDERVQKYEVRLAFSEEQFTEGVGGD